MQVKWDEFDWNICLVSIISSSDKNFCNHFLLNFKVNKEPLSERLNTKRLVVFRIRFLEFRFCLDKSSVKRSSLNLRYHSSFLITNSLEFCLKVTIFFDFKLLISSTKCWSAPLWKVQVLPLIYYFFSYLLTETLVFIYINLICTPFSHLHPSRNTHKHKPGEDLMDHQKLSCFWNFVVHQVFLCCIV